jgi:hypothetical protein
LSWKCPGKKSSRLSRVKWSKRQVTPLAFLSNQLLVSFARWWCAWSAAPVYIMSFFFFTQFDAFDQKARRGEIKRCQSLGQV